MYTIYYIFIGIIILSFITGVILNKIEKNTSSQSAISSVTSTSTNIGVAPSKETTSEEE